MKIQTDELDKAKGENNQLKESFDNSEEIIKDLSRRLNEELKSTDIICLRNGTINQSSSFYY